MGYMDADYYYNPEAFGLEVVATVDWDAGSYEFDYTVVWYHKASGKYYYADDSGCSCPSPFEAFTAEDLSDMAGSGNAIEVANALRVRLDEELGDDFLDQDYLKAQVTDAAAKIMWHRASVRDNG